MKYAYILLAVALLSACDSSEDLTQPNLRAAVIDASGVSLSLVEDNIPADGTTYAEIHLKLASQLLKLGRTATLTIEPFGTFSNGKTTYSIDVDDSGSAKIFATALQAGIAYIRVKSDQITKTIEVKFQPPATQVDNFTFTVTKNLVPADNYSYAEISVEAKDLNILKSMNQVKFTADRGSFTNDSKEYNVVVGLDGKAKVYLKYNKAELIRITATAGTNYSKELFVQFTQAWPDQILVEPSAAEIVGKTGASISIRTKLLRDKGVVSDGIPVIFEDTNENGKSIGIFVNTTKSNSTGESFTEYLLQDANYKGLISIKATVNGEQGKITGVNRILIK